ncbi:ERBB receptor feedback inhibitor 1 [Synchiropus splendidus]|uniref:ERBB receptor feedback inhibitor 1 n=1 Tax=Synchiropus splendidus TaxID=270530 RepID=UPI00237E6054|nr:ERBB receptor feedback inhibitor 1 [Synchiropus splendidus]
MAKSQSNFWGQHDLSRACLSLSADLEHNLKEQQMDKDDNSNLSLSQAPFYSDTSHQTLWRTNEGDQVVPAPKRHSMFGDHQRESKPLPPLPDPEELMSDEAADNEVEFFTSDRQRLLPRSGPKSVCRSGFGQVNYAYQENLNSAFSWPGRGSGLNENIWMPQRDHLRPETLSPTPSDKPEVPPRIPIRPKPLPKTVSSYAEDRPPKIPPRVPLVPPCPPRSPSPKTLPIYINGVMPATQSFAANPKYVSKALLREQSQRAPPAPQLTPCIVPIVKDGRQASNTHYILLPPRRPSERRDRLMSEPVRVDSKVWQKR